MLVNDKEANFKLIKCSPHISCSRGEEKSEFLWQNTQLSFHYSPRCLANHNIVLGYLLVPLHYSLSYAHGFVFVCLWYHFFLFTWSNYPCPPGLLPWHWSNCSNAPRHWSNCSNASEGTLDNIGKIDLYQNNKTQQNKTVCTYTWICFHPFPICWIVAILNKNE